jgi:eukaryotic-like serine/threonine-protein kinase
MIGKTIGHYRIVAQVGAGGMGVVYRAHDERLDRDVALKVLPVGTLGDEKTRKQFRREALALAKLNHPNIETVHEFGTHDDMDFLAMELIPGQTLSQKIKDGPLSQHDVLRLGIQFADGLSAAHEQGIIHRDIKPGNLIVTPDGRLKILDFGLAELARPQVATDLTQSVTVETGAIAGTIPYMSPEQLRGLALDPRADIFAAGAVLYEMATGRRPFPQSHSVELMAAILHKTPDRPSSINAEVSPGLDSVICKTLEKEPSSRYHTARELRAALDGISAASVRFPPSLTPPSSAIVQPGVIPAGSVRYAWIGVAATLISVLLVGLCIGLNVRGIRDRLFGRMPPEAVTPINVRRSVAVLGFKNASGRADKAWISTAVSEMLSTELAAGEQLRTVSGEDVAHAKRSLALADTDSYGQETLHRIHQNLDVDVIVTGSFVIFGENQIRLDLRLQDASQGVTLASVSEKGTENQLDDMVSRAGGELRAKLGAGPVSSAQAAEVKAALPSSPEATRLYSEGLRKLREFDNIAARDLLQKTVLIDPNQALAHSALSAAYSGLGYDEKARQSARNAFELSARLPREDRLLVEARYREANKEWDHAIENYGLLFGFFPDNLEYGILLAQSQIRGGKSKDALKTIETLRRLPAPAREDPRIDLAASNAYSSMGDFKQAQAFAAVATSKARANNVKSILAPALFFQAAAFENLSQAKAATAAVDEAASIYKAAGDRSGEARSLEVSANVLADQGDFAGALAKYKEQLAVARDIGNRKLEASGLNNMALLLSAQGDPDGARQTWERSLLGFRDISDKPNSAEVLINIAGVLMEEGDLSGATKTYGDALAIFQEVNDQHGVSTATAGLGTVLDAKGDVVAAQKKLDQAIQIDLSGGLQSPPADKLVSLADVLLHQGNLTLATKNYQDALAQSRASSDKTDTAYALFGLGKTAVEAADFPGARKYYQESLEIRTALGETKNAVVTQVALAELAVEEGNPADAAAPISSAREEFRKLHDSDLELGATTVLIRVLLAQGKTADAAREVSSTASLAAKSQSLPMQIEFAIASARVEAASGKTAVAVAHLKAALAKATNAGLVRYQLECRLAIEDVQAKPGRSPDVQAQLDQLERDAKSKGYDLIARKAAAMRNL